MYAIKSWKKFQHYNDRNPPWIKLHKNLLDDFDFQSLPLASKALAPMLWLLASEHENPTSGVIDLPPNKIAFRLRLSLDDFLVAIKPLINNGFVLEGENASNLLADCEQVATPETETETENRKQRQRQKIGFLNGKVGDHARQKRTGGEVGEELAAFYRARSQNVT